MRQDHAISVEVGHKVRRQGNEDAVVGREGWGGEGRLGWGKNGGRFGYMCITTSQMSRS